MLHLGKPCTGKDIDSNEHFPNSDLTPYSALKWALFGIKGAIQNFKTGKVLSPLTLKCLFLSTIFLGRVSSNLLSGRAQGFPESFKLNAWWEIIDANILNCESEQTISMLSKTAIYSLQKQCNFLNHIISMHALKGENLFCLCV